MKKICFITMIILVSLVSCAYAGSDPAEISKSFVKANESYENGDYQTAAALYEEILREVKNGHLYYNLGNSYFRQGRIGYALANYLRAKRYLPGDSDINDNISYLRTLTKDNIEDKIGLSIVYKIFFYYDAFNLKEFFLIFTLFNVLFFSLAVLKLYTDRSFIGWTKNIVTILLILSLIGLLLNYSEYYYNRNGVVVSSEISVRSGSSSNDTVLFNLHEGTGFDIIDENADWLKIRLLDNKKGWVMKQVVEVI